MPINNFREDEQVKQVMNIQIIKRLFCYLKPYKLQVIKTLLLIGIVITVELINPYYLKIGVDKFIEEKSFKGLLFLGVVIILINIVSMICSKYRTKIMAYMSNKILFTIRQQLFNHIQKLSFSFYDSRPVGKILARIIGDVNSLGDLFINSITTLIPDFITIIAVMIIMFSMNYRLALVSFITLPFLIISMFLIQIISRKRWQVFRQKNSNLNAFTHEDFSGIKVIQSFTAEKYTSSIFNKLLNKHKDAFVSAVRMNDFFWPLVELSWGIGTVIVFWYGVPLITAGYVTKGTLAAFVIYISMFWMPIMRLSNFYNILITNMAAAERIFEILDIRPDIEDSKGCTIMPPIKGNVDFKNVYFSYEQNQKVLNNISFNIKAGETIALVGPSGAGKTTIANLISRFYDVSKGEILIDGYNVKNVSLESLRNQMAVMTQDTFMFSGTIKDNIRYGKLDATDDEIVNCAKAVCAHDFITKLEKGYDTDVNERGSRMSTGQRQLIAFARALLSDPKILILDEATASIDTHTERLIQKGIAKLLKGRTAFVIAHRLSTIENADRIMVIDEGQIKESGNHEQLIKNQGIYYELYMTQHKFLREKSAV